MCLFLWPHIKKRLNREEGKDKLGTQELRLEIQPAHNCQSGPANWLGPLFPDESVNVGTELDFRNVCLRKPNSTEFILSEINGKAQASTLTGIMGQSGSGKSRYQPTLASLCETDYFRPIATLVNILVGKIQATSGSLFLNGVEKKLAKYAPQSQ
jgi:ABC-type glutathione transport system ATPase component